MSFLVFYFFLNRRPKDLQLIWRRGQRQREFKVVGKFCYFHNKFKSFLFTCSSVLVYRNLIEFVNFFYIKLICLSHMGMMFVKY